MRLSFWLLILIISFFIWISLNKMFPYFGNFIYRKFNNVNKNLNKEEEKEKYEN